MAIHTADAIVLRQYPYRETSALVTCLTNRFGKIKGLIKGLHGLKPRYRSAMEPLTLNRIVFYEARTSTLHLMTQCDLLCAFSELQRDLEVMRLAASCVELVDAVVELEEPYPELFHLLSATLGHLTTSHGPEAQAVRVHFVLRLLRLVGFQPQLDECTGCGQHPHDRAFWSPRQGGLLCERCLHEDPSAELIEPRWLAELVRYAEADEIALDVPVAVAIQARLDEFLRWRLDRPLKTLGPKSGGQGAGGRGQEQPNTHAPRPTPSRSRPAWRR